jgi:uncharacterized protein YkwD
MASIRNKRKKTYWSLSILTALLLFGGLIVSLAQLRSINTLHSRAENTSPVNCTVPPLKQAISSEEQSLFDLINEYREQQGLPAYIWSQALVQAASWLSEDMLTVGKLSHVDSLGRNVETRVMNCGYDFSVISENIDSGTADAQSIFNSWKHSPAQNANLLSTQFKEVGIALSSGTSGNSHYWTMNAGNGIILPTPPMPSPILITPSVFITPSGGVSITSVPSSKTPTPSPSSRPPSPTPTPVTVYPVLKTLTPNPAAAGSKVTVTGTGGYKRNWNGLLDESARSFQLFLDGKANTRISCAVNHCQGQINIPSGSIGNFFVSVEGGSKLSLKVMNPVPSVIPSPTLSPSPTPPPEYVPNPLDMQLLISAKLSGIGSDGNKQPVHKTREVTVTIFDTENSEVKNGTGFLVYDGSDLFRGVIHFGPVENGIYYVKVGSEYTLASTVEPVFQQLNSNRLNVLPFTLLMQGDMNKDNVIDIKDYNTALGCFQNKRCDDAENIDFNEDGSANIVDYNILLQNFWESPGD